VAFQRFVVTLKHRVFFRVTEVVFTRVAGVGDCQQDEGRLLVLLTPWIENILLTPPTIY
jgi:hypothetical protein